MVCLGLTDTCTINLGPGMMGMMGSSMAGSMAGSVIGHGISNMMFGGKGGGASLERAIASRLPLRTGGCAAVAVTAAASCLSCRHSACWGRAGAAGEASDQQQEAGYAPAAAVDQQGYEQDPCGLFMQQFRECIQQVEGDNGMTACKWNLDQLRDCRHQNGQASEF